VPEQEPELHRDPIDFRFLHVGTRLHFSLYLRT
jgi:hypothetical protein